MLIEFHPDAQRELEEAVAYYDSISYTLGNQFITEVKHTLERIENFPAAWPRLSTNTRRCRTASFPYGIVYQFSQEYIWVLAVMHLQREPNYWLNREEN